jgi:hypothetical protein
MGLTLQLLPLLDAVARDGGIQSPVWMLGSQQFPDDDAFMSEWAKSQGYPTMERSPSAASLFRDRYSADYADFDFNEDAAVHLDLTAPLDASYGGGAGTVIDIGTLEHVFDLRAAMETAHAMVRVGGTFVTVAPVTWWAHGFVNFNPKFFRGFAAANGYEPLTEGYLVRVQLPRFRAWHRTVITRRSGVEQPRARLWVDRMMNRLQPARLLYCGAFRKTRDAPFVVPQDVFGNW